MHDEIGIAEKRIRVVVLVNGELMETVKMISRGVGFPDILAVVLPHIMVGTAKEALLGAAERSSERMFGAPEGLVMESSILTAVDKDAGA